MGSKPRGSCFYGKGLAGGQNPSKVYGATESAPTG